ncbi:MAG: polysaccharide biosynthesis protein [Nitrospinota bacterium]|nr:polysaccharide biosynthesis protein [Nitrospinota bacterium]
MRWFPLIVLDLVVSVLTMCLAFFLRFDGAIPENQLITFYNLLPFLVVCRIPAFLYFGLYARFWEYSSLEDLLQIVKAVMAGSLLILFASFMFNRAAMVPRSVLFIDMFSLMLMLGGLRLVWRLVKEREHRVPKSEADHRIPVLIMGAGYTGMHLFRHLRSFSNHYWVVGFIDNDPKKLNSHILGIKVMGSLDDIPELKRELGVKEVLIAINGIDGAGLSRIVETCQSSNIKCKTVSSIFDLSTQQPHISTIRNIEITDLLGREPVSLDLSLIKKLIVGKRVMVTGAGGSIGSELCRQLLEYEPESLIMMDRGENYLYDLNMELAGQPSNTQKHYHFGSVTHAAKLESIFAKYRPHLVFHAAAHKHVPLMESNVEEAIYNNVRGTQVTADMAEKYQVEKFILVSTDKVVRPTSVMGMTKKIAEKYIQYKGRDSQTRFMTVRFGNVLGSNGSVVPLFKRQIEKGGPVTVTHPDMERYFMLIPEAVQLILQSATLGEGGEIFLLEMGSPVKLMDLAEKMIRLMGYSPNENMEIKVTGIRPGEKLYEELIDSGEEVIPTTHKKIKRLKSNNISLEGFPKKMDGLYENLPNMNNERLKTVLFDFIASQCLHEEDPLKVQK